MSGSTLFGRYQRWFAVMFVLIIGVAQDSIAEELSLKSVLEVVKKNDFQLKQYQEESRAYLAEADAAAYLPDPTVFAAIQSLPTDTFEFDQEPMTQLRVGVRQMFPKGDAHDIKSDMAHLRANLQLIANQQRWLERRKRSEQAWLEAWY